MKKLTILASAIALTFCVEQNAYSDEVSTDTAVNTNSRISTDKRSDLIQKIEKQMSELREYQAKRMSEKTTFEWFGFILNVANSIRESLAILHPDSPEVTEAEKFANEVARVKERIPEGASPAEVITTDKLTQEEKDQVSRIKAQLAAKIERLEALLDELKSNESNDESEDKSKKSYLKLSHVDK